jgi:hypothetical protein
MKITMGKSYTKTFERKKIFQLLMRRLSALRYNCRQRQALALKRNAQRNKKEEELLVYKFRSFDKYAIDIIEYGRLYCAKFDEFNDPKDGWFVHFKNNPILDDIKSGKLGYKICSLSDTYKPYLLWTHYANGFEGIAIEIDIDDTHKIKYKKPLPYLEKLQNEHNADNDAIIKEILTTKHTLFKYEKEARILCKEQALREGKYYKLQENAIKRILFFDPKVKADSEYTLYKLLYFLELKHIAVCNIEINLETCKIDIDNKQNGDPIKKLRDSCLENMKKNKQSRQLN